MRSGLKKTACAKAHAHPSRDEPAVAPRHGPCAPSRQASGAAECRGARRHRPPARAVTDTGATVRKSRLSEAPPQDDAAHRAATENRRGASALNREPQPCRRRARLNRRPLGCGARVLGAIARPTGRRTLWPWEGAAQGGPARARHPARDGTPWAAAHSRRRPRGATPATVRLFSRRRDARPSCSKPWSRGAHAGYHPDQQRTPRYPAMRRSSAAILCVRALRRIASVRVADAVEDVRVSRSSFLATWSAGVHGMTCRPSTIVCTPAKSIRVGRAPADRHGH